jgi:putative oxidoreductase
MSNETGLTLLLGRVLMSVIFLLAGYGKLTAMAATTGMMAKHGLPVPAAATVIAIVVELGGGLLLLFGLFTRPVGLVLGLWCIATALIAHTDFADPNMRINFLKNLAMAGGFAYVAAFGAGAISLDAPFARRRAPAAGDELQPGLSGEGR